MTTVLITHGCFSCHRAVLHRARNVSASCAVLPVQGLGTHKELGGDRRDIPHHVVLCSAIKAEVKKREGGKCEVTLFVFPSNITMMSPACGEVAEHLPADGK